MAAKARGKDEVFPIIEAFGYSVDAVTDQARDALERRWCPFAQLPCEKYRQYSFGYCSVTYSAADDGAVRRSYAVCDHRLDGPPLAHAIRDYFGSHSGDITLTPEVVLANPRTSFDYAAFTQRSGEIIDVIVIEAQAIDIRGGGVGPAWRAWMDGRKDDWRRYFTEEAKEKGRKDTVSYGVNMANIYKRLGLQVADKGAYLKGIGVPLYIVMQDRPYRYLKRRIDFEEVAEGDEWDITFITFDYTGDLLPDGSLEFAHVETARTTLGEYIAAMTVDNREAAKNRGHFLDAVKRKAGLSD